MIREISFLFLLSLIGFPFFVGALFGGREPDDGDYRHLYPRVYVGVYVDEKYASNALGYFLGMLEEWRYPKDRMQIGFFVDSTSTELADIMTNLERWTAWVSPKFYRFTSIRNLSTSENHEENWRELALVDARLRAYEFALLMDTDSLLVADTLRHLVGRLRDASLNTTSSKLVPAIIAPLLNSPYFTHSNLHNLMDEDYVTRKRLGTERVYYANGPLLINLKHRDASYLTFDSENLRGYAGNGAPIDVLARSAYAMDVSIVVDNMQFYGYFVDSRRYQTPQKYRRAFNTFLANLISETGVISLPHSSVVAPRFVESMRFGFDAIFLINLERRPERLRKMTAILDTLGIDFEVISAVDGERLDETNLRGVEFLPGYLDPFHRRPMKRGEIGCFLSHANVWRRVLAENLEKVIVLEDDLRFTENGLEILIETFQDLMKTRLDWEFIYLGRKKMSPAGDEFFVPGHRHLSTVGYSYWTLGYAITAGGARKLLDAKPLKRLMALDEFLPIAYGRHPNAKWTKMFGLGPDQLLRAYAAFPVVVEPERYTHQPGYVSDTENSSVVYDDNETSLRGALLTGEEEELTRNGMNNFLVDGETIPHITNVKNEL